MCPNRPPLGPHAARGGRCPRGGRQKGREGKVGWSCGNLFVSVVPASGALTCCDVPWNHHNFMRNPICTSHVFRTTTRNCTRSVGPTVLAFMHHWWLSIRHLASNSRAVEKRRFPRRRPCRLLRRIVRRKRRSNRIHGRWEYWQDHNGLLSILHRHPACAVAAVAEIRGPVNATAPLTNRTSFSMRHTGTSRACLLAFFAAFRRWTISRRELLMAARR